MDRQDSFRSTHGKVPSSGPEHAAWEHMRPEQLLAPIEPANVGRELGSQPQLDLQLPQLLPENIDNGPEADNGWQ